MAIGKREKTKQTRDKEGEEKRKPGRLVGHERRVDHACSDGPLSVKVTAFQQRLVPVAHSILLRAWQVEVRVSCPNQQRNLFGDPFVPRGVGRLEALISPSHRLRQRIRSTSDRSFLQ